MFLFPPIHVHIQIMEQMIRRMNIFTLNRKLRIINFFDGISEMILFHSVNSMQDSGEDVDRCDEITGSIFK